MGSIDRKIRRKQEREAAKHLDGKVGMFVEKLPENCLACESSFDKTDREQVSTWRVVVREKEEKVNLYCPECWDSANQLLQSIRQDLENKNVQ